MFLRIAAVGLMLLAGQSLQAQDGIRLKARPEGRGDSNRARFERLPAKGHYVLEFKRAPGPETRQELARRGLRVLQYVPDNALLVAAPRETILQGLDLSWAGALDPADKISPLLNTAAAGYYLAIFHPDTPMDLARALAVFAGFDIIENPSLLPAQLLIGGSLAQLPVLAAQDEVAYIMPASPDLVAGELLAGCAGAVTESGPVADYVEAGRGWQKDAHGVAALQYSFVNLPGQPDPSAVEGEIQRAFREWARYANITFTQTFQPVTSRTLAILFARGAHGDSYPFNGPAVLAHTFYPAPPNSETIAGDMHFNLDEDWHIGVNVDVFTVALHEAGHALGLAHSDRPGAVMYPYYRLAAGLTADDIAGIRDLYGSAGMPNPDPPPPPGGGSPDTTPPSLQIVSPAGTIFSTTAASLTVSGTAADNIGVVSVRWNDAFGDTGVAAGTAKWSFSVPLLVGTNTLTIRAYDAAGNSGWRAVTIVRH